jgi:hypothetical protein
MLERVAGRLDPASAAASSALRVARETGLIREEVAGLTELGRVLHLGGRRADAWVALDAALARVRGTSFRVQEGELRVLRGRLRLLDDERDAARAELSAVEALMGQVHEPQLTLRLAELRAGVAAVDGDAAGALGALSAARSGWERLGLLIEAARVAADAVRLGAWSGASTAVEEAEALRLFGAASDPLGPVHVAIARGLGLARRGDDLAALDAFAAASRAARALGTDGASRMARVAEDDAAAVLLRIQPASLAQERAAALGLTHALAGYQGWLDGKVAYEAASKKFKAADYAGARVDFLSAAVAFETVAESDNARTCRRGAALSAYNEALGMEPSAALPRYAEAVDHAAAAGDAELGLRARVGWAVAMGKAGSPDARARLREVAMEAEAAGQAEQAGRAWASLAGLEPRAADKADAARRAWGDRQDQVAVVAMYNAAVAAYNQGDLKLAGALLREVQPGAGAMAGDVAELLRDVAAAGG